MGLQAIIQETPKTQHCYDKNLGFGEAPANVALKAALNPASKEKLGGMGYITKHIREFFTFKT